jgi:hypothetical protein
MKLVILGAGASYDSHFWYKNPHIFNHWRPPLANEIFDTRPEFLNIIEQYPSAQSVFSIYSTIRDLEDYFQKKYDQSQKHNSIEIEKTLINLRYYLQHLFYVVSENMKNAGYSNIDKLIGHINDYVIETGEDVLIVNFNYDLLVEQALQRTYYNSSSQQYSMHEYLSNKIKLIKPHGSCNWFRMFTYNAFHLRQGEVLWQHLLSNNVTQEAIDNRLSKDFYVAPYSSSLGKGPAEQMLYMYPQIFIPLKEKDDFCMPKEQVDYLLEYLPKVEDILIIGWKGYEAHFNNILKENIGNKTVRIQVVNGPANYNPGITIQNLSKYINTSNSEIFTEGINTSMIHQKQNIVEDIYRYVEEGSLSSFFINIENNMTQSIFN